MLELAKQGNAKAIAFLINHSLQPSGVTTQAVLKDGCLQIMLESAQVPNQQSLVAYISKAMTSLGSEFIRKVKVYGRKTGEDFPTWDQEFEVVVQTVSNFKELAKLGDVDAITTLINQWLHPKSITAKASLENGYLQLMLESIQVADEQTVVHLIREMLMYLNIQSLKKVKIYGRKTGKDFPDWQQEFELESQLNLPSLTSENVVDRQVSIPSPELEQENHSSPSAQLAQTEPQTQETKKAEAPSVWGSMFGAVAGAVGAVGGAAAQAGQAVVGTAVGVGGAVASAGLQAPEGVGYLFGLVGNSSQLQQLTKALRVDWLIKLIDQVDIVKAETQVKKLQQQYPHEQASEIAHRLMLEKSLYVGGSGLASSLVPGFAAALIAVDLAATTAMQAEMVYQIACAYGLNLKEPARKGEVIAIFGLALGGGCAIKAGLVFLRNVPVAGAVVGASTNAAMLYTLGYAACRFYEAKVNPLTNEAAIATTHAQSEKYLEGAIVQEVVMDQILVHVVLAGNPGKTWDQILPELFSLNLSPASMEVIAANIKSPPRLETLLNQINRDFAVPLLAQCQKIAQLDEVTTKEEAKVIETITKKFGITLDSLKQLHC